MRWPSVYMGSPGISLEKGCGEQGQSRGGVADGSPSAVRERADGGGEGGFEVLSVAVRAPGRASGTGSVGKW